MRMKKAHWIGIIFSVLIITTDIIFFREDSIFFFLLGVGIIVLALPFLLNIVLESKIQKEKDMRFLEFARNLAESVKSGNPIGQSILNMRNKNFGSLSPHISKLANQISLGIPINRALQSFANDIESPTVSRAVALIREAESAGGKIDNILDSVAKSIYQIEKLKKERRAAIYNLVVQGYLIFFIFIGIMLVMQFKVLPLTADIGGSGAFSGGLGTSVGDLTGDANAGNVENLTRPFLYLLIVQGVFTGLMVGKLSEGSVKAGIKHSFILAVTAFLISSGASAFL